jgi:hypothetical protein
LVCFVISSVPPPSNFWWQGLQNNGLSSQTHIFGLVSTCCCKAQYKYETSTLERSQYTLTRTYSSLEGCAFYPHSPCFANYASQNYVSLSNCKNSVTISISESAKASLILVLQPLLVFKIHP